LLAALGTAKTSLDAILHVANPFATGSARAANFGARLARYRMMSRVAGHEVHRRLTDFGAVEHQPHVRGLSVLAAHFQTVRSRHLQAHHVTVVTVLHALLHFGGR
jgi:hypothetical protein